MKTLLGIVTASAFALACASTSVTAVVGGVTTTVEAELRSDFTLAPGQAATVDGTRLAVLFRSVTGDSRCPVDVQCVWAGDAEVLLTVSSGATGGDQDFTLHTTLDPKAVTYSGYEIRLTGVNPAPRSAAPIQPASYRVTLRVVPAP